MLNGLESTTVYRYASIAETIALCRGLLTLAKPMLWRDKYEAGLVELLGTAGGASFSEVRAKSFSLEYSSEAMWRVYSANGGLVRTGISLSMLIERLGTSELLSHFDLFLGRVRYLSAPALRVRAVAFCSEPAHAISALFLKRAGFSFENELRLVARHRMPTANAPDVVSMKDFPVEAITRLVVDPYASKWQADELKRLFNNALGLNVAVKHSEFDRSPRFDRDAGE